MQISRLQPIASIVYITTSDVIQVDYAQRIPDSMIKQSRKSKGSGKTPRNEGKPFLWPESDSVGEGKLFLVSPGSCSSPFNRRDCLTMLSELRFAVLEVI